MAWFAMPFPLPPGVGWLDPFLDVARTCNWCHGCTVQPSWVFHDDAIYAVGDEPFVAYCAACRTAYTPVSNAYFCEDPVWQGYYPKPVVLPPCSPAYPPVQ